MKVRIRDFDAEKRAKENQHQKLLEVSQRPYPYNVPDFIPFVDISCYKEVKMSRAEYNKYLKEA